MEHKIIMYKGFERIWHWLQGALILFLLLTGFEMHGNYELFGYNSAYTLHIQAAWALLALTAFAIVWHITTGEWRQYIPTFQGIDKVVRCYTIGIFYNEPHPYKKIPEAKLNPLQRLSYLSVLLFLLPLLIISGLACYYYNELQTLGMHIDLGTLAIIHTAGAFLMLIFQVVHIYMTTTGETPWAYTLAMITGREDIEEDTQA